jgi:hypothetical protein
MALDHSIREKKSGGLFVVSIMPFPLLCSSADE